MKIICSPLETAVHISSLKFGDGFVPTHPITNDPDEETKLILVKIESNVNSEYPHHYFALNIRNNTITRWSDRNDCKVFRRKFNLESN